MGETIISKIESSGMASNAVAIARLKERGFPTLQEQKDEYWKYTNPVQLLNAMPSLEAHPAKNYLISDSKYLEPGFLQPGFGTLSNIPESSFGLLAAACENTGAVIKVQAGERLNLALNYKFPKSLAGFTFPRLEIDVGEGGIVTIIESYESEGVSPLFIVPNSNIKLGRHSKVEHYRINTISAATYIINESVVDLSEGAVHTNHTVTYSGGYVRNAVAVRLHGKNAHAELTGISRVSEKTYVDNITVIDHAVPDCTSNQNYKGVYDGESTGTFAGTIIVREDAQHTNAYQSNKSIVLAPTAKVYTRPQLKIWANDVKCTHGATVGELDSEALFYLRSRGIAESSARDMLINAFFADITGKMQLDRFARALIGSRDPSGTISSVSHR